MVLCGVEPALSVPMGTLGSLAIPLSTLSSRAQSRDLVVLGSVLILL